MAFCRGAMAGRPPSVTAVTIAVSAQASGFSGWAVKNRAVAAWASSSWSADRTRRHSVPMRQARVGEFFNSRRTRSRQAWYCSPSIMRLILSSSPTKSGQQNLIFFPVPPGQGE